MAIYVVIGENPFFKRGTYVEDLVDPTDYDPDFEVDVPMQQVQAVEMHMERGRYVPGKNYGIAIGLNLVRSSLLRIQKTGVDKSW